MTKMAKIRVGVLRGGPSSEYEVSLKSGETVLRSLPEKFQAVDIFIDKAGVWHIFGLPVEPGKAFKKVDVVLNAMHGEYGEDGTVQRILESFGVPFTGSGSLASAVGMNKHLTKEVYKSHGLKTPHSALIKNEMGAEKKLHEIFRSMPMPAVVKPVSAGSSVGVSIVHNFHELEHAVIKAFKISPSRSY